MKSKASMHFSNDNLDDGDAENTEVDVNARVGAIQEGEEEQFPSRHIHSVDDVQKQDEEKIVSVVDDVVEVIEDTVLEMYDTLSQTASPRPKSPEQLRDNVEYKQLEPPSSVQTSLDVNVSQEETKIDKILTAKKPSRTNDRVNPQDLAFKYRPNSDELGTRHIKSKTSDLPRAESDLSDTSLKLSVHRKAFLKEKLNERLQDMDIPALVKDGAEHCKF
jgi:hypothetical protein